MKNFDDMKNELSNENPSLAFTMEIVGKLMAKRDAMNMSQRQLSEKSGVAQKTISRIENGLDIPTIETLGKLANALGMKIIVVDNE